MKFITNQDLFYSRQKVTTANLKSEFRVIYKFFSAKIVLTAGNKDFLHPLQTFLYLPLSQMPFIIFKTMPTLIPKPSDPKAIRSLSPIWGDFDCHFSSLRFPSTAQTYRHKIHNLHISQTYASIFRVWSQFVVPYYKTQSPLSCTSRFIQ